MKQYMTTSRIKSVLTALVVALCISTDAQAQSILETTTFEAPQKLVRPKSEWVNIRTRPSTSAPKAKDKWGYEEGASKHKLLPVEEENAGWYRIGTGRWISKQVAKPVQPRPITDDMMNRFFGWSQGYDEWGEWTISPVGKLGFYVYMTDNELRLGKMVGDVLVFKYCVNLGGIIISDAPEDVNKFNLEADAYDGEVRYTITVGHNFTREMKHAQLTDRFINLQLFNDRVLERLFKDKIEKEETDYMYITSDLLSGEYENYELG